MNIFVFFNVIDEDGDEIRLFLLLVVIEFGSFSDIKSRTAYQLLEDGGCKRYSPGGNMVFVIIQAIRIVLDKTYENKIFDNS